MSHLIVQTNNITPISDIRYNYTGRTKLVTMWQQLKRDMWLIIVSVPPLDFLQIWLPLFFNIIGMITQTSDSKGNNYANLYIFAINQFGVWGLFDYYNLFNFDGWFSMVLDMFYI